MNAIHLRQLNVFITCLFLTLDCFWSFLPLFRNSKCQSLGIVRCAKSADLKELSMEEYRALSQEISTINNDHSFSISQNKYLKIESKLFTFLKEDLCVSSNLLSKLKKNHLWLFTDIDFDRDFLPMIDILLETGFSKKNIASVLGKVPTLFQLKSWMELEMFFKTLRSYLPSLAMNKIIPILLAKPSILLTPLEDIVLIFQFLIDRLHCDFSLIEVIFQKKRKLWLLPPSQVEIYYQVLTKEYEFTPQDIVKMLLAANTFIFTDDLIQDIVERNYLYGDVLGLTKSQFYKICHFYPRFLNLSPNRIIAVINAIAIGLGIRPTRLQFSSSLFAHNSFTYLNMDRLMRKLRQSLFYLTNLEEREMIHRENIRVYERNASCFLTEQLEFERRYGITWLSIQPDVSPPISEDPSWFRSKIKATIPKIPLPSFIGNAEDDSYWKSAGTTEYFFHYPRYFPVSISPKLLELCNTDLDYLSQQAFFDAYYCNRVQRALMPPLMSDVLANTSGSSSNEQLPLLLWQNIEYDRFVFRILQNISVDILPASSNDLLEPESSLLSHGLTKEDVYRYLWMEVEQLSIPHASAVKLVLAHDFCACSLSTMIMKLGLFAVSLGLTASELESILLRVPR